MARVSIDDLWLKDDADGNPPTATVKRSLANARDPMKAKVPEKWRTPRYGIGKRWRCRWFVIKPDGSKQAKTKVFDKLYDAEEFQAALEDDIRRGRYVDPNADQRLFQDVADQWIETKLDVKPATLGRYQRELRVYINPTWGGKTLREITPNELQSWVNKLSKGGYKAELPGKRKPRPLSPRSIRNIVKVVMAAVFEYAITNKWIRENPAKLVTTPRIVSKDEDMVFLTVPEVELLADEATAKGRNVDGLLVRFLAYTGVRISTSGTAKPASAAHGPMTAKARCSSARPKAVRQEPSHSRRRSFPDWRNKPPGKARTSSCSGPSAADTSTTTAGAPASGIPACATPAWKAKV